MIALAQTILWIWRYICLPYCAVAALLHLSGVITTPLFWVVTPGWLPPLLLFFLLVFAITTRKIRRSTPPSWWRSW
ncbi:hypothetical protein [Pyruvatibacter sp.]